MTDLDSTANQLLTTTVSADLNRDLLLGREEDSVARSESMDDAGPDNDLGIVDDDRHQGDGYPASSGSRWFTALTVGAVAVICGAIIGVLESETEYRTMFLVVPFAAVIAWVFSRVSRRRTVLGALAIAILTVLSGFLGDYIAGVWGLVRFSRFLGSNEGVLDIMKNPRGMVLFMAERVWSYKDYLLWASAAVVGAVIAWPPVRTSEADST